MFKTLVSRQFIFRGPSCLSVFVFASALWIASFTYAAGPPQMLRDDFTIATVVAGLSQPTCMAWVDDKTLLVLEKAAGTVRIVRDGKLLADAGVA